MSVIEHAIRLANERSDDDNDDATTVAIGEDACALIRGRRSPSAALPGALWGMGVHIRCKMKLKVEIWE